MPAADFCDALRVNRSTLSHDSVTRRRPPEVSSTAFDAQPPDLPPAALMDVGFAAFRPLAPCRRPHHPVLVHRLAPLLHASFRPHLATAPLRFAITSPPSGCEEDFHLLAVKHARHTKNGRRNVSFGRIDALTHPLTRTVPKTYCFAAAAFFFAPPLRATGLGWSGMGLILPSSTTGSLPG